MFLHGRLPRCWGIDLNVVMHHLQLNKERRPVQQRIRLMSIEKQVAIEAEVQKLLEASFIQGEKYPT